MKWKCFALFWIKFRCKVAAIEIESREMFRRFSGFLDFSSLGVSGNELCFGFDFPVQGFLILEKVFFFNIWKMPCDFCLKLISVFICFLEFPQNNIRIETHRNTPFESVFRTVYHILITIWLKSGAFSLYFNNFIHIYFFISGRNVNRKP